MTLEKLLNSKYIQFKQIFLTGIIVMIGICILFTLYAIITGQFPQNFIEIILSTLTVVFYCFNSIICLKTVKLNSKIPWGWIGVALCTLTEILLLTIIWTNFNILSYGLGAIAITLTYTSAIIPFSLIKAHNNKVYNLLLIAHRIITPIFGLLLMVDFIFEITTKWILQLTWGKLLIEIFIVLALSLLYIFPHYKKIRIEATDEENIFKDAKGNIYQLISSVADLEKDDIEETITSNDSLLKHDDSEAENE